MSDNQHWVIRSLDFPRLQFAILAIPVITAQLLFLDGRMYVTLTLVAVTACCLIWQLWWILPYTFLWPTEVKTSGSKNDERQISILTSNVLTPNRNANALIALVRKHQPDVLVTLESDQWWEDHLSELETEMPYSIKCPLDNLYGMHVYSRLPLDKQEICFLVEKDIPSIHATIELRSGDRIRAHFLHPAPPSPEENQESEERDTELVIVARSVGENDEPVIVAGDLNDVAWSATTRLFRKTSGLQDPRIGRGMFNTFHAKYPLVRWPLDHLFHSRHFTLQDIRVLPSIGSDHFPLLTRLSFTPAQHMDSGQQKSSEPDNDEAKDVIDEQKASKEDVPTSG